MNQKEHLEHKKNVRALVITGFGINCEQEMAAAYHLAGASPEIVHLNDVLEGKISIHDYDILNFPGGFSFGDDLGSGKVLANKIRFKAMANGKLFFDALKEFLADGKYILGVCNGFQALVKAGLLPNVWGKFDQEVTLATNDSGKFEDRWSVLKKNPDSSSPFLKNIDLMNLPVRHGEGKLIITDELTRTEIVRQSLNCMSYADGFGKPTPEYPFNPNGSVLNCAALTDPTGRIFGIMPHPEAFLSIYNHPDWPRLKRENPDLPEQGEGVTIFTNIVQAIISGKKSYEP